MPGWPQRKGFPLTFYTTMVSQADPHIFQVNPTIAAGDFQISRDDGAFVDVATLPDVMPAASAQVRIQLSAVEMNADMVTVLGNDQAGAEWRDVFTEFLLSDVYIGDIDDEIYSRLLSISPVRLALRTEDLRLYRGDTWLQPITGLGNLTDYTEMWVTAREDRGDTDAQSAFQVLLSDPPVATDGLQYINGGRAGTPGNAAIAVTGLAGGTVSVRIEAVETAKLTAIGKLKWDFQWTDGTDVETRKLGDLFVITDVTRVTG